MSHSAISVYVTAGNDSDRRVRIACDLAHSMHAKLIGLGCEYISAMAFADGHVSNRLLEIECERVTDELARRERRFRELAGGRISRIEWRASNDYPLKSLVDKLRTSDLLILGPDADAPHGRRFNPATVIMQAGRPVLFVPDPIHAVPLRRAVIAWKDSRESRRALADSLPYLKKAKDILLLGVCEDEQTKSQAIEILSDVGSYLGSHDLACELKAVQPSRHTIAEEILLQAKKFDADLIVAGAYGHSQVGEWIFGGVTETLLAKAPCACLFSH